MICCFERVGAAGGGPSSTLSVHSLKKVKEKGPKFAKQIYDRDVELRRYQLEIEKVSIFFSVYHFNKLKPFLKFIIFSVFNIYIF